MQADSRTPVSAPGRGRFQSKKIHVFREQTAIGYRTYCGLSERDAIWQPIEDEVLACQRCFSRQRLRSAPLQPCPLGARPH